MEIKVLGTGCDKCKNLEANAKEAIRELGIEASIEKIEDLVQIMKYGVMSTPGLVINDKVRSVGKVLKVDEIKKLIHEVKG
ncbi:thioredoxin family protein [Lutispora sp.]|uniref:thioredoxin family protein n=1 Tax=Lutispora sp. TaxID=2828727 RepID=UPI000EEADB19|nr:thioredoxin family protein [Lutispora sp.]MEA4962637.1 thioredoxin family protein [Lutispora sp.]HCJ58848.1 redox-active disulfide protein 2 [Clostridiaceae bacterium]